MLVFKEMIDYSATAMLMGGVFEGIVIGTGKASVTIVEQPSVFSSSLALPLQHVVLRPVEVGGIDFEKYVVDEAGYINTCISMDGVLGLA